MQTVEILDMIGQIRKKKEEKEREDRREIVNGKKSQHRTPFAVESP